MIRRDFKPTVDPDESFSTTGQEVLPDQWWKSFNDEKLDDLMEIGLSGNFDLKIAFDRLAQSQAVAKQAGADLSPKVDLTGVTRWDKIESRNINAEDWTYNLGLNASYEVDLWGRIRSGRDAAALDAMASREDTATAAITLTSNIASRWYELAEAQNQIRVLQNQIEINRNVLEILELQFRQGQAQAADVLRQQNLIESNQGSLVIARRNEMIIRYKLAVLLGLPPTGNLPFDEANMIDLPPLPATGLSSELLQRRPDVRSSYRNVQATDRRLAQAIADQYPRISLTASADTFGEKGSDLFNNWAATLAANLFQPLIDGERRKAEIEKNEATVSQALDEYAKITLDSLNEVEQALENEQRQVQFISSLTRQLDTSRQVIERTRDSYLNGQLNYIDVLAALTTLQNLERDYVQAKRELIGYRIDLCKSIAGGWDLVQPDLTRFQVVESSPVSPDQSAQ